MCWTIVKCARKVPGNRDCSQITDSRWPCIKGASQITSPQRVIFRPRNWLDYLLSGARSGGEGINTMGNQRGG
jgi:hypothetical protein